MPRSGENLAHALGVLTARVHNAGFVHRDFHPGNVLIRIEAGDRPALALIDLDALRVCRKLTWDDAQHNLALLNHYFWLRSGRADRRRFLKAYLEVRGDAPPNVAQFAQSIETSTRSWAEQLWRRWGKRCQRTNKYFEKLRGPHSWAVAARELERSEVYALLADPDEPFRRPETIVLKDSRTATVAATTMTVNGQRVPVVYKRFHRKKWLDPLYTYFRPSRAWQAWQAGQHMASRAVPTPTNLAYLARTRARSGKTRCSGICRTRRI